MITGNYIGDKGTEALGETLRQNNSVTELDLSGLCPVASFLFDSSSKIHSFAVNKISIPGVRALSKALSENTTLVSLYLRGMRICFYLEADVDEDHSETMIRQLPWRRRRENTDKRREEKHNTQAPQLNWFVSVASRICVCLVLIFFAKLSDNDFVSECFASIHRLVSKKPDFELVA